MLGSFVISFEFKLLTFGMIGTMAVELRRTCIIDFLLATGGDNYFAASLAFVKELLLF